MKKTTATLATTLLALTLAACGSNEPDVAACKAAMKEQFTTATSDPDAPAGTKPPACEGIDDATLQRLAGEVMGESIEEK